MTAFLLEVPEYEVSLFEHSKSKSTLQSSLAILREVQDVLSPIADWSEPAVRVALMEYATGRGYKTGTVMWPVRVALTGRLITPGELQKLPGF